MSLPPPLAHLPAPPPEAAAVSAELTRVIHDEIAANGGRLPFRRYMELALYAPGLGYYSAGSRKFGAAGDFITAPELSPLFGRCLARQVAELRALGVPDILEVGAGSGALAADLLNALGEAGAAPDRYLILEVSAELQARQRETLATRAPRWADRVTWLAVLPERLHAIVIGNEVLDAIPTALVRVDADDVRELAVAATPGGFAWTDLPAAERLRACIEPWQLPAGYRTEVNLAARAFVMSLARLLERGVLLFIDYGHPARDFYHPQRNRGTLMCHYRHHAHDDPLVLPGLQDITAHVDFTAIAEAGVDAGLEVSGYTHQSTFLINTGLIELLSAVPADDVARYAPLASQAQQLIAPSEMGDRFKVIALAKGITEPLTGFDRGDRTHQL